LLQRRPPTARPRKPSTTPDCREPGNTGGQVSPAPCGAPGEDIGPGNARGLQPDATRRTSDLVRACVGASPVTRSPTATGPKPGGVYRPFVGSRLGEDSWRRPPGPRGGHACGHLAVGPLLSKRPDHESGDGRRDPVTGPMLDRSTNPDNDESIPASVWVAHVSGRSPCDLCTRGPTARKRCQEATGTCLTHSDPKFTQVVWLRIRSTPAPGVSRCALVNGRA
jgi:hypothetical protein